MRKPKVSILVIATLLFAGFTLGVFCGRNRHVSEITVTVAEDLTVMPSKIEEQKDDLPKEDAVRFPVPINTADKEALMQLPGIGDTLAERILAYRRANGPFRSEEELLLVEGIGKKRLEEIWDLIIIGG